MNKRFLLSLVYLVILSAFSSVTQAQNIPAPDSVTIAGTFQSQLGCSDNWQPDCEATSLTHDTETDLWTATWELEAGRYEYKAALNGSWDDNFGLLAEYFGPNITLEVPENMKVTFSYDHESGLVTDSINNHVLGSPQGDIEATENPDFVTIPGTIQEQLGCPANWQPDCEVTFLTLDEEDDIWQGAFVLAAGDYEYKVAIDQSWGENYGGRADRDGPNVTLTVPEDDTLVKFYYDHKTNWVADNINSTFVTITGDFQDEAGCLADNDPGCLRSWLQDPDGDGIYTAEVLTELGDYEAIVAINESLEETYGFGGVPSGEPYTFTVRDDAASIFFSYDEESRLLTINTAGPPKGDISARTAYWVTRDTIAWDVDTSAATDYFLYYSLLERMSLDSSGVSAETEIPISFEPGGLNEEITTKFPHLTGFPAFKIGEENLNKVRIALKGQIAVGARDLDGSPVDAAGLQIAGILDDVYPYDGPLGVTFDGDIPTLTLWAPTARSVSLHLFNDPNQDQATLIEVMRANPNNGTWAITGDPNWYQMYYLYEVEVYVPAEGQVIRNLVTDPYSVSLAINSSHSQIIDPGDPTLVPEGWNGLVKPELEKPTDIVLYELHLRDFSARDESVPDDIRGTYLAFTESNSDGMRHLISLADAGLTHIHLLPTFDIATIDEDKANWRAIDFDILASFPPDSEEPQARLDPIRDSDGFNWGYDPYHYNVPEGSYSTEPNGPERILEFRRMVQAINNAGLRVVIDVVYNHTNASGQAEKSVLDRIVPGYYHRLDAEGRVETSTCCANTATEHDMMRRLMVDSVVYWATEYKIDGFRFDLMGHHMVSDMQAVREALNELTLDEHGVDGVSIYVYGEGWDFGEVANGARGKNATQLNVGGLGIGTFNDRIRDAVRGGNPFGGYQEQGFATGLWVDSNEVEERDQEQQHSRLLHFADQIRVALAGNLAEYSFEGASGEEVLGRQVDYNGAPTGYAEAPSEHISYISAHDNETWFDAIQAKVPVSTSMEDRVKIQNLGLSLVMYSQGIPFFHSGSEMLRSKSFDRDSYNSGDWFNAIDWSYSDNNWGHGLPPADKNQDKWDLMRPLLADSSLAPNEEAIHQNVEAFQQMLRIRQSSPLFHLQTAEQVQNRVRFHNTGPQQIPGLIVMSLSDIDQESNIDEDHDMILVLFNANPEELLYELPGELAGVTFSLHPVIASVGGTSTQNQINNDIVSLPARSAMVFVVAEGMVKHDIGAGDESRATTETDITPSIPGETDEIDVESNDVNENDPNLLWLLPIVLIPLLAYFVFIIRRRQDVS